MRGVAAWLACAILLGFGGATAQAAVVLPAGFVDERVGAESVLPTALAFLPDGTMLVASKGGLLFSYAPGNPVPQIALDYRSKTCIDGERGQLGLAVDPAFSTNRSIYIYYTARQFDCSTSHLTGGVNRVSRFAVVSNGKVDPKSELPLVDKIPSRYAQRTGGDIEFGKDGLLYATVGDGGCHYSGGACHTGNTTPQETNTLLGKIVRVTRDGAVPAGNPYRGTGTTRCNTGNASPGLKCQEIFASGLRNPFRFAFDPNASGTRFFINDVGWGKWEEVNDGRLGANYGWPLREGPCKGDSYTDCPPPPIGVTDPLYAYRHDTTGCTSITGGAFVPQGRWPAPYDGSYMFADYMCGKVFRLAPGAGGGYTAETFATNLPSPIHFEWGPVPGGGEALYYISFDTSDPSAPPGQIRRIRFVGAVNRPPGAELTVSPASGPPPLAVTADAGGSLDPDGDPVTYLYDFGDGSRVEESASSSAQHTYATEGNYTVTLRVRDAHGLTSDPVTRTVTVATHTAQVRVVSPSEDFRFTVGQRVMLRAEATGADGQPLPGSAITWTILKHHDDHVHPFLDETPGESVEIEAPPPEDLRAATRSYLEVRVTARDSDGTTVNTIRDLRPKIVKLGLNSTPPGVDITANGVLVRTNQTFDSWPGYRVDVVAPSSIRTGLYTFRGWNDGEKSPTRMIITIGQDFYYNAVYKPVTNPF